MTISRSAAETMEYGRQLAASLKPGDIIALTGDLGAGKTCLVKGIAAGLGLRQEITSPTFTIVHEYPPLAHVDLYRVNSIHGLGLEEYFGAPWITVIEWAEKIELPEHTRRIRITIENENSRRIED